MLSAVMDHGQQLKISGWQMAGINCMKRVLEQDSLYLQACKPIDPDQQKNSKMLVF